MTHKKNSDYDDYSNKGNLNADFRSDANEEPVDDISNNGRRYSLGQKLSILADLQAGVPEADIVKRFGGKLSRSTIYAIKTDQDLLSIVDARIVEHRKKNITSMLGNLADLFLSSITHKDILKTPPYQRVVAASILLDKQRLLSGESTHNIGITKHVHELQEEKSDLLRAKEALLRGITEIKDM